MAQQVCRVGGTRCAVEGAVFDGTWISSCREVAIGTRYPSPSVSCRVLCVLWYPGHSVLWRVMDDAGWCRVSLTVFLCLI